ELLLWRIGVKPAIYPEIFYLGAALFSLTGLNLVAGDVHSGWLLVTTTLTSGICLPFYTHWRHTFVGVSDAHILLLFLSHCVGLATLLSTLRILYNRGLR